MRAYDALSAVLPAAGTRSAAPVRGNTTPGMYNPHEGRRVQQAWQRYSIFQWRRPAVRPCVPGPSGPARPVACR
jgi:hypothetical protein